MAGNINFLIPAIIYKTPSLPMRISVPPRRMTPDIFHGNPYNPVQFCIKFCRNSCLSPASAGTLAQGNEFVNFGIYDNPRIAHGRASLKADCGSGPPGCHDLCGSIIYNADVGLSQAPRLTRMGVRGWVIYATSGSTKCFLLLV